MKFNKTVAKALVFTMALSALPFTGLTTSKAAAPSAVAFDGVKGVSTSTGATHWGIAVKEKNKPKKLTAEHLEHNGVFYKVKALEAVKGDIDLGKYKGKALFIALGSTSDLSKKDEWKVVEVKAADKKFKPYYFATNATNKVIKNPALATGDDTTGYLTFVNEAGQIALADAADKVEVRAGSGDWKAAKDFLGNALASAEVKKKLGSLIQNGAKLSFRLKGSATGWGSKEVKLAIPAQKKGPNVKLDFVKGVTNFKTTMEYKIVEEGAAAPTALDAATEKHAIADLTGLVNTGADDAALKTQDLYVRVKKTDRTMTTKFTKIKIKKLAKPTVAVADLANQGGAIVANEVFLNLNVAYDVEKGALLTNKSTEKDYEFAIGYDGTATNLKWIKLKKAKDSEKPTKVQIKASKTPKAGTFNPVFDPKPSKLFLRLPGVKQDKDNVVTLPGPAAEVNLKLAKIEQALTITTAAAGNYADITANGNTFSLKVATATNVELPVAFKLTNVTKREGKPKFKLESAPKNVKVSVDEFVDQNPNVTFNVNFSFSEKAFPADSTPSGTIKFSIEHESSKQTYTVTIKPTA